MKRKVLIILALIIIGIAWFLFRPERIFISQTVNEEFPGDSTSETTQSDDSPKVLFTGQFHGVGHETKGAATIHQLADGKKVLRLTDFETSNGPNVHVYLVSAPDANDNDTVTNAGFLDIGSLKGNIGDQNYDLPAEIDLAKYQSVTIWCQRFGVNFGTAPLVAGEQSAVSAASPVSIYAGSFHSVAHETKGAATVYQLGDGKKVLRLTEFETSNGPDVRVYLVAASDANDSDTVTNAGFIEVGSLKGNIGDQNYDLPADVDLAKYGSVTIWCKRFGVNFGTAPLVAENNGSAMN